MPPSGLGRAYSKAEVETRATPGGDDAELHRHGNSTITRVANADARVSSGPGDSPGSEQVPCPACAARCSPSGGAWPCSLSSPRAPANGATVAPLAALAVKRTENVSAETSASPRPACHPKPLRCAQRSALAPEGARRESARVWPSTKAATSGCRRSSAWPPSLSTASVRPGVGKRGAARPEMGNASAPRRPGEPTPARARFPGTPRQTTVPPV